MSKIYKGKFTSEELGLYEGLDLKDINIILEYQKKLPCLQEEDKGFIDGRVLHEQLVKFQKLDKVGVPIEGTEFATWIERRIEKYEFVEGVDFTSFVKFEEGDFDKGYGNKTTKEYNISTDMAKNLCMIENNDIGKLSRKYFISIEKAFKSRYSRNNERQATIDTYHDLKKIIFADTYKENKLAQYIPSWWNKKVKLGNKYIINTYAYELHRINEIIIGISAKEYKEIHGLKDDKAIRNTFTEKQLADYTLLQSKSAEYIKINEIWDTNERLELLEKFYKHKLDIAV